MTNLRADFDSYQLMAYLVYLYTKWTRYKWAHRTDNRTKFLCSKFVICRIYSVVSYIESERSGVFLFIVYVAYTF